MSLKAKNHESTQRCPHRYLITGGCGLIGSALTKGLVSCFGKSVSPRNPVEIHLADRKPPPVWLRGLIYKSGVPDTHENSNEDPTALKVIYHCLDLRSAKNTDSVLFMDGLRYFDVVCHLAADMGGMGYIAPVNGTQTTLWNNNLCMMDNVFKAWQKSLHTQSDNPKDKPLFLYASTACVYRDELQNDERIKADNATAPKLSDNDDEQVFPLESFIDKAYESEKIVAEQRLFQFKRDIASRHHDIPGPRVLAVRFHNVYGKSTEWNSNRSKLPLASLRKALAAKQILDSQPAADNSTIEIPLFGDGTQKRSFLSSDDAAKALIHAITTLKVGSNEAALAHCSARALNIGSETEYTVREVVETALMAVGICEHDREHRIRLAFDNSNAKTGVQNRNCCSDTLYNVFQMDRSAWPALELLRGLSELTPWMRDEVKNQPLNPVELLRREIPNRSDDENLCCFGLLLPITSTVSYPTDGPEVISRKKQALFSRLKRFVKSLYDTTSDSYQDYAFKIFIGFDHDDWELKRWIPEIVDGIVTKYFGAKQQSSNKNSICYLVELSHQELGISIEPRGAVCHYWSRLWKESVQAGCDFTFLAGDDIIFKTKSWPKRIDEAFHDIQAERGTPFGFGVVAFKDLHFPGFPTFPVFHRFHFTVFGETEPLPDAFFNQDADPFLFQLYRRFNAAKYLNDVQLSNTIGGADDARYQKVKGVDDWIDLLNQWTRRAERYSPSIRNARALALDIITPSFRCERARLERIYALTQCQSILEDMNCTVGLVIIVDNPAIEADGPEGLRWLHGLQNSNPLIRVRVNDQNRGASGTRNRGISESSADWIHFLDDDVIPEADLCAQLITTIRQQGDSACGFVGDSCLGGQTNSNVVMTARQKALHFSGVAFFWRIARWKSTTELNCFWGVTANLAARRINIGKASFNELFPKTGGGEDIDYCIQIQRATNLPLRKAPKVTVCHPYWDQGQVKLSRFSGWAYGDGLLNDLYPEHTLRTFYNESELSLAILGVVFTPAILAFAFGAADLNIALSIIAMAFVSIITGHVALLGLHFFRLVMTPPSDSTRVLLQYVPEEQRPYKQSNPLRRCCNAFAVSTHTHAILVWSNTGRMLGQLKHGSLLRNLGRRFTWWGPSHPEVRSDERRNYRKTSTVFLLGAITGVCIALLF